jgi:hypothetical protein
MLERYKRTLLVTQAVIAVVSLGIFVESRMWEAAVVFFLVMQFGALVGAMWAARLKRRIERGQGLLVTR